MENQPVGSTTPSLSYGCGGVHGTESVPGREGGQVRELRVVGVEADTGSVICHDASSGDSFTLPVDDRLRAACRGDLSRLGQIEIETESALRPREIQARIRAGASVAQVAAAAGVSAERINRFAHPVLLERERATELAAASHPLRVDGPADGTLADVAAAALNARGHNPDDAVWDAWKGDDNRWVVQIAWNVGRSDMHAHWRYVPGAAGGVTEPLDETADELIDPDTTRPLTGIGSVVALSPAPVSSVIVDADNIMQTQRRQAKRSIQPALTDMFDEPPAAPKHAAITEDREPPVEVASEQPASIDHTLTPASSEQATASPAAHESPTASEPTGDDDPDASTDPATTAPTAAPPAVTSRRKPARKSAVPAWEDVLLGVRSNGKG